MFWLEYGIATHRHFLGLKDSICLLSHEQLCREPSAQLEQLGQILGTKHRQVLLDQAKTIKASPDTSEFDATFDADLLKEARVLYAALLECTASAT
jgi:hypothetical protein|tara:strand:- start:6696 stop:6983 length:288 start_codon:yes stop_codon:yes gene_type:complete